METFISPDDRQSWVETMPLWACSVPDITILVTPAPDSDVSRGMARSPSIHGFSLAFGH